MGIPTSEMGYDAMTAAVALCKGDAVPQTITTDFVVVTSKNLPDARVQALLAQ